MTINVMWRQQHSTEVEMSANPTHSIDSDWMCSACGSACAVDAEEPFSPEVVLIDCTGCKRWAIIESEKPS